MANNFSSPQSLGAVLVLLGAALLLISTVDATSKHFDLGWHVASTGGGGCGGSIAECGGVQNDDVEFGLDSESNRRILATTSYISYGALQSNTVPCSQKGASYYNCKAGASANPYSRGCSQLARCRS